MSSAIHKLAERIAREADKQESRCIRLYGSADDSRSQIMAKRRLATGLRVLAQEAQWAGINLKITRAAQRRGTE